MQNFWNTEPTSIIGLIRIGITLSVSFGLELTNEQTGLIIAFTEAMLTVLHRSRVTPVTVKEYHERSIDPDGSVDSVIHHKEP
jgi:hypothetical protein